MSAGPQGGRPTLDVLLKKETQIVALRAAGATWAEIGRVVGMDRANAHKVGLRALRREHSEAVDDLRRTESDRLDRMQRAVWLEATQGDRTAIDRVLRIMERRARLFGLDAPQRHTITSELDDSIETLLAQLGTLPPVPADDDPLTVDAAPEALP